jgi:hypothetical protein
MGTAKKKRKDSTPKGRFAVSNVVDLLGAARCIFRMERLHPSRLPPDAPHRPPFKGG